MAERNHGNNGKPVAWILAHQDYPHEDWCLFWPFGRDPRTGRAMIGEPFMDTKYPHRIMCELVNGPAPIDKPQAAHSCGNGHLACINPHHLDWKNNSENQLDRTAHGRVKPSWKKMFTPEKINELKRLRATMTQWQLADHFNCSLGTVQYYLKYRDRNGYQGAVEHWALEEDKRLAELLADGLRHEDIAKALNRPKGAVSSRASKLKLKSRRGSGGILLPRAS